MTADRRVDPLTGVPVVVTGSRQARPNLPSTGCPFCVGGLESPAPYDVRSFVNRWPTFDGDRCEVVLYTPHHDATMPSLGVHGVRRVVDLWADRTEALAARDDVDYVLVFENSGAEVGATIPHPHGQIYAYADVPPRPRAIFERLEDGATVLEDAPELVVHDAAGWRAWVPHASGYPYGMRLAPIERAPDLPSIDSSSRDGLARALVDVLARLDRLFGAPMPYMLWWNQRPSDGGAWPSAHVHLEIAPILRDGGVARYVAGAELATGVLLNPVEPAAAAARLRDA